MKVSGSFPVSSRTQGDSLLIKGQSAGGVLGGGIADILTAVGVLFRFHDSCSVCVAKEDGQSMHIVCHGPKTRSCSIRT